MKDPHGANLDRVQVSKGWLDAKGNTHERIYDIGVPDGRRPEQDGRIRPVGTTVDVAAASYTNTIGDPDLAVVWEDPEFNPDEGAFYCVRVIEISTSRWSAYDASRYGLAAADCIRVSHQERAYSSPIWYHPSPE